MYQKLPQNHIRICVHSYIINIYLYSSSSSSLSESVSICLQVSQLHWKPIFWFGLCWSWDGFKERNYGSRIGEFQKYARSRMAGYYLTKLPLIPLYLNINFTSFLGYFIDVTGFASLSNFINSSNLTNLSILLSPKSINA